MIVRWNINTEETENVDASSDFLNKCAGAKANQLFGHMGLILDNIQSSKFELNYTQRALNVNGFGRKTCIKGHLLCLPCIKVLLNIMCMSLQYTWQMVLCRGKQ